MCKTIFNNLNSDVRDKASNKNVCDFYSYKTNDIIK